MRIQVNISDEVLKDLDEYAKSIGIPKGSLITSWIGEKMNETRMKKNLISQLSSNPEVVKALGELVVNFDKKEV